MTSNNENGAPLWIQKFVHRNEPLQEDPAFLEAQKFLNYFTGHVIQYLHDEDPAKNPDKAFCTQHFDPQEATRKQLEGCGVFFTPNAFKGARRTECLDKVQSVFVDIDLAKEGDGTPREEIEKRKTEALVKVMSLPLRPHGAWYTKNGLQVVWLLQPSGKEAKERFDEVEAMLIAILDADPNAKDVTRVLRLPNFLHLKNPFDPYLCQLVYNEMDRARFDLDEVLGTLRTIEVFGGKTTGATNEHSRKVELKKWQESKDGVSLGNRNAAATTVVGRILHDLAEELWETVGFGGLKAWNEQNTPPLPEKELRSVFDSISESERRRRKSILDSRLPLYTNRDNRETEQPSFALQSIGDFLAEPEETLDWVVQDLLPAGGFSLCVAKPKVGKSTEARNLIRCVARGEPYLGRATTQGKVLYLAFEEKRGEVRKQFAQMGLSSDDPILLFVDSALDGGLKALGKAITEEHPILVVVDPLFLLLPVKDVNDYADLMKKLDPLRSLARENGCHIQSTHHANKMGGSGGDSVLGSTAIFGTVDTLIQMRKRDDGSRIIHSLQRYGTDLPETVLSLDRETGLTATLGDLETIQTRDVEGDVFDAMGDEELTEPQIRDKVGGNQRLTSKAIRTLHDAGKLTRTGNGTRGSPFRYRLAGKDVAAPVVVQTGGSEPQISIPSC